MPDCDLLEDVTFSEALDRWYLSPCDPPPTTGGQYPRRGHEDRLNALRRPHGRRVTPPGVDRPCGPPSAPGLGPRRIPCARIPGAERRTRHDGPHPHHPRRRYTRRFRRRSLEPAHRNDRRAAAAPTTSGRRRTLPRPPARWSRSRKVPQHRRRRGHRRRPDDRPHGHEPGRRRAGDGPRPPPGGATSTRRPRPMG